MKKKAARCIDNNCNINQELSFAHPVCRIMLNKVYNCQFRLGFSSAKVQKVSKSPTIAVNVIANLPIATHRYMFRSISGQQHI